MELFITDAHYIVKDGENSLWCCRESGNLESRSAQWIDGASNPICLGTVEGIVGRVQYLPDAEWRLVLVTRADYKGDLPGNHRVFQIAKIAVLPLNGFPPPPDFQLNKCRKHSHEIEGENGKMSFPSGASGSAVLSAFTTSSQKGIQAFKTFGDSIKSAAGNVKNAAGISGGKREFPREKYEKKVSEEIHRMFGADGPGGFFYSPTGDLTNSIQHQHHPTYDVNEPLHKRVDKQFIWNHKLLEDLNPDELSNSSLETWFTPIIFGFVQIDTCQMNFQEFYSTYGSNCDEYKIALVSRRSRYRAGTRYKRRGIDQEGHVANFVETEQIIEVAGDHVVSFVQTRGSIPVFWSQPGFRYRPPPRLYKDFETSHEALKKHFENEVQKHGHVNIVSLVDDSGKEKILGDAYIDHILAMDSPHLTYISFDFHEYCRGLKFENVSVLLESIQDILKNMRYSWVDHKGLICDQKSVFRINCVDCLDRTNIVQTAIARNVMEIQFRKVGLLPPEVSLPSSCRIKYQEIWANNGDALSRQYAGTAALKGDFTRTGERRFAGLMKDGYNSASRYYLNQFKDAYRQLAIDILSGQPISDDLNALTAMISGNRSEVDGDKGSCDEEMTEECVKLLIDSCRKDLLPPDEYCLGGWALIDAGADDADDLQTDMDIVLLLSQAAFYVASYDDEDDKITHFQRIPLDRLDRIEVGLLPEKTSLLQIGGGRLSHGSGGRTPLPCIRLHFRDLYGKAGYSHLFRAAGLRFFNNMAVRIHTAEESTEALKAVYESFAAATNLHGFDLPLIEVNGRLNKHKSHTQKHIQELTTKLCLTAAEASGATLPKNFAISPGEAFMSGKMDGQPEKNYKNLLPGNVGSKLTSKLSPSSTSEFGHKIADVGRGMNKLVSTLNPLKLSPSTLRKKDVEKNPPDAFMPIQEPSNWENGSSIACSAPHNNVDQYSNDVNYLPSLNVTNSAGTDTGFPEEQTAFSRMKQSFSETSLGGIASATLGSLLDPNAVSFHASTGEIAMSENESSPQPQIAYHQVGEARGTFLKNLPIPKLPAGTIKLTLSPGTPQRAVETERELAIINKIQKSQSRVLRL